MIDVEVDISIDKDASGAIQQAQRKRLEDSGDYGFAHSQELVPEDRGTLRQSGYTPVWDGDTLRWGYRADHALPIEQGTAPFQPPLKPLLEWSKRVTGDPGLGYYVALHKIPEEGIDKQEYAKPGAEKQKQFLKSNSFGKYLDREL